MPQYWLLAMSDDAIAALAMIASMTLILIVIHVCEYLYGAKDCEHDYAVFTDTEDGDKMLWCRKCGDIKTF